MLCTTVLPLIKSPYLNHRVTCKDYKCLPERNHALLIEYWKQILNSGSRNEIEGIWSKKDYEDDIKSSLQSGGNLNIVLYLVYGNTNL